MIVNLLTQNICSDIIKIVYFKNELLLLFKVASSNQKETPAQQIIAIRTTIFFTTTGYENGYSKRSIFMLRGTDFILNPEKLEKEFQLVEVADWLDFNTKEKLGYYYTVLLPKLRFEKMKVGIRENVPIVTNEELEREGQIPIIFENLKTWARLYKGRISVKAEATKVQKALGKQ